MKHTWNTHSKKGQRHDSLHIITYIYICIYINIQFKILKRKRNTDTYKSWDITQWSSSCLEADWKMSVIVLLTTSSIQMWNQTTLRCKLQIRVIVIHFKTATHVTVGYLHTKKQQLCFLLSGNLWWSKKYLCQKSLKTIRNALNPSNPSTRSSNSTRSFIWSHVCVTWWI